MPREVPVRGILSRWVRRGEGEPMGRAGGGAYSFVAGFSCLAIE